MKSVYSHILALGFVLVTRYLNAMTGDATATPDRVKRGKSGKRTRPN